MGLRAVVTIIGPDSNVVDGVILARELVNEPPNVLFPVEFARRAGQLRKLGVDVEILDVKAMTKLGMGALLGVAQGSTQPGRTVIMRWNGGKRGDRPVAFVGKGVCFDTGEVDRPRHHFAPSRHAVACDAWRNVAISRATDDAALLLQGAQNVVAFVALVRKERRGVGVRHRDRFLRALDSVERRFLSNM